MKRLFSAVLAVTLAMTVGIHAAAVSVKQDVAFSVNGENTYPGEVVVLRVEGVSSEQDVTVQTGINFEPKFYSHPDGGKIALLPVSYYTAPGEYNLTINSAGKSRNFTITVNTKEFETQHLTVPPSTAEQTILSQKANAEYEQVVAPLRPVADNMMYWDAQFILPCSDKKVTTQFGLVRYTNGSSTPSRHGALDLAVPHGTNVAATGNGRVIYSGYLQLTGNTIIVEHGYGLKSWHYHMNSRSVETGDLITQGQIIGTVGTTGFSTGPHLHFGMSVNNVFINPYTAINTDLLI